MTDSIRQPAVLSPSPRHMRKRRFRRDVPPSPTVGRKEATVPAESGRRMPPQPVLELQNPAKSESAKMSLLKRTSVRRASLRQKRLVALAFVIFISLSIPLLVLTLIFGN